MNQTTLELQRALNGLGEHLTEDGIPGPLTAAAVSRFQATWNAKLSALMLTETNVEDTLRAATLLRVILSFGGGA